MSAEQPQDDDRELDAQLRAAFSPPSEQQLERMATEASRPHRPMWPWLVVAAAAMMALALWLDRVPAGPEGHDGKQLGAMWVAAFDQAVDSGFGGASCCAPGTDLAAECERWCGKPLALDESDAVDLLGSYCGGPTGGCLGVMLQVDGDPVCVFVVPRDRDPRPVLPAQRGLQLARRELGSLVLYAVSSSPRPGALAEFSLPSP